MFSNLSSSSISLATVTPSLVMRGAPNDLSSTTLRPLGPSVTGTALVRMSTPRNIRSRASTENFTSLAAILLLHYIRMRRRLRGLLAGGRLIEHAHDVALLAHPDRPSECSAKYRRLRLRRRRDALLCLQSDRQREASRTDRCCPPLPRNVIADRILVVCPWV